MANLQNSNGINNGMLCNSGVQHGYPHSISNATSHNPAPLYALNPTVQALINDVVITYDLNPDYLLAGLLGATAGLVGRKLEVSAGNVLLQQSALFCLIVGNTGTAKSSALMHFIKPIEQIDEAIARKTDAEHDGIKLKKYNTILTKDGTYEAIANKLARMQHANTLLTYNEINDALSVTHSNTANLRNALTNAWDGFNLPVERATKDDFYIIKPRINVLGAIQPQYIKSFLRGSNGFAERFLIFYPTQPRRPILKMQDAERVNAVNNATIQLINELHAFTPNSDIWQLTPAAFDLFAEWRNSYEHADVVDNALLYGITSKITANGLRLALNMQVLNVVTGHGIAGVVETSAVQSAIVIADYCLRNALRAADYVTNPSSALTGDNALVYDIAPNDTEFAPRDLYESYIKRKNIIPTKYDSATSQVRRAIAQCVRDGAFLENEKTGRYRKV